MSRVNELGVIMTPKFVHDCDQCVFLGHALDHDVYFCAREPTLIARWGSAGWEYHSGLVFMRSFGEGSESKPRESQWLRACALLGVLALAHWPASIIPARSPGDST